jgi:hypothetical protein
VHREKDTELGPLGIVDVTDEGGEVVAPDWLVRAEAVHRQLRPQIPPDYVATMRRVFDGGGRMCVATSGEEVIGIAVYRVHENTFAGVHLYVDDLVTADARRSTGVGKALIEHLDEHARRARCVSLDLDSGVQRSQAHKFYFREGFVVSAFHFDRPVTPSARDSDS